MTDELQQEGEEQPHLLLVDDDPTFTRVMARAMSRRDCRSVSPVRPKRAWRWPSRTFPITRSST